jgi:phage terminase large subunit-like protein/ribosomal protein L37AE/L43A
LASCSVADHLRSLPPEERLRRIRELTDREALALYYDWSFWARPNQLLPGGDWTCCLVMAGRGFGKSRMGAETVRTWKNHFPLVNIIGPTADDAREVMVEGDSGILAVCPPWERPTYLPSKRQLEWRNGSKTLIFTADEPERLRGHQHNKLWCDEVASWRYAEAWDQAMLGLRLGAKPQVLVTTTPKPLSILRSLRDAPTTVTVRGTTYENRANLSQDFIHRIIAKYEGTRIGRQELNAELLEDNPGALWTRANLDANRVFRAPQLRRVVVAIDPAVSATEESDETGLVIVGSDDRSPVHYYVLEDLSRVASPDGWAAVAVSAYHAHRADRIIGEVNNGGEMIQAVIRHKDPNVAYRAVRAARGKAIRAEPIAALYEQNWVHHVGFLARLEDQMCDFNPAGEMASSPDRMDALVWGLTELSSESESGLIAFWRQEAERKAEEGKDRGKVAVDQAPSCPKCGNKYVSATAEGHWKCAVCDAKGHWDTGRQTREVSGFTVRRTARFRLLP